MKIKLINIAKGDHRKMIADNYYEVQSFEMGIDWLKQQILKK